MNIYMTEFFATCPNNNIRVHYKWTLEADRVIEVEDLIDAVTLINRGFHEEIADQLYKEFGHKQILCAFHHGTFIKSIRP